ncbi:OsmC family protein [Paenibacillus cremeus]|uniref:OsmC family peroxiredoxin n=1 Tax=Paenibacillus cremeus TaxID=2163881 RepID=A0A559JRE4_9BACL|nr:OsmC family protein [Paenibacillus cremeus]TVY02427.1 hypothetical protein FPZ49_31755 [Paenibacillus cremeus]
MSKHHFRLNGTWKGGLNGEGHISTDNLHSDISAPHEMGGLGKGTNPEEMLLGASATCYMITLGVILSNRKLPVQNLELSSEAVVSDEVGLVFEKICHYPTVTLSSITTSEQVELAKNACLRAEKACMISKALRGNVEITVTPKIVFEGK